jgi:cytochrome b6-f complex iron-sulfur subunit
MTLSADAGPTADSNAEMSRREFLNYAWLASIGILVLEAGIVGYRFAMPRLAPGEFGGVVDIGNIDDLPPAGSAPEPFNKAKFWWVQNDAGALALYKVCTHLGCIFDWKEADGKFICPCHGSQFQREGAYIAGPAPRGLDKFVIRAYDDRGKLVAETDHEGNPVAIPAGSDVQVDTGERIPGAPKGTG